MTDKEVALAVFVEYGHLPRSEAVKIVASKFNTTRSTVAGRASRYYNTISGRSEVMRHLAARRTDTSQSDHIINGIIADGKAKFAEFKGDLHPLATYTAVKISDIHFPYADFFALELAYEIISRLGDVRYISVLDDMFDFPKLSNYEDSRRLRAQALDDDIADTLLLVNHHLKTLHDITPDTLLIAVPGNHDMRIANHHIQSGVGVYNEAMLMQWFDKHNVVFFDRLSKMYPVQLTDNLVWAHGWKASSNRVSCARANYQIVKRELGTRYDFNLIFGHTHDMVNVQNGVVEIINGGCLCELSPHYMRFTPQWQQGMVISQFQTGNHVVNNFPIRFNRRGNRLTAFVPPLGDEVSVRIRG